MKIAKHFAMVTLATIALAACTHTPPPPPLLSVAATNCPPLPDMAKAKALSGPDGHASAKAVNTFFDANSPCIAPNGGAKRVYAVFALPQITGDSTIRIAAPMFGEAMFAPSASLLSADGQTLRTLARSQFTFRGGALTALVRAHSDERYLLVTSDPDIAGTSLTRIQERVRADVYPVGAGGYFTIHTGSDIPQGLAFTVNGPVEITLEPLASPKKS